MLKHLPLVLACIFLLSVCAGGQKKTASPRPAKPVPEVYELILQGKISEAVRLTSKSIARAEGAVDKLIDIVDAQIVDREITKAQTTLKSAESFVDAYAKAVPGKSLRGNALKGRNLRIQGIKLNDAKEYAKAESTLRQALTVSLDAKDARLEGGIRNNLGFALQAQGKLEDAVKEFEAARDIAEKQDDPLRAGSYNFNLGRTFFQLGRMDAALAAYKRSADQNKAAAKPDLEARAMMMAGIAQSRLDSFSPEAMKFFQLAFKLFDQIGDKRNAAWCLYLMGDHTAYTQRFADAAAYGEKAVLLLKAGNDTDALQKVYEFLSEMYGKTGAKEKSDQFRQLADEIARKQPQPKKE